MTQHTWTKKDWPVFVMFYHMICMIWLSNSCVGSLDWNLFFNCFAESSKSWIMKLGKVPQDVPTIWRNNKIWRSTWHTWAAWTPNKTMNIDHYWLYKLLKQIWSISSLGVLGYQRPGCGFILPYLSRPPTTEWWWLWVKSFQRFLWSLCGQAIFLRFCYGLKLPHFQHSQKKHLEPSCWSVLDHYEWLWRLQAV